MMPTPRFSAVLGVFALTGAVTLSACGVNGSGTDSLPLSPIAAEGRFIVRTTGCGACHGINGQGGVGPAFIDLFGSVVQLSDGSVATANREYLIESIKTPAAKQTDGFKLPMPANTLTDDEIDKVLAYIEALATPAEGKTL